VSLVVLELDDVTRQHLALALRMHVVQLRRNGHPVPRPLVELEAHFCVPGRQEPTEVADPARVPDASGMALAVDLDTAARTLHVSRRTVERAIATGALPAVHVGRSRRIRIRDLRAYVDNLRPAPGEGRQLDGPSESAPSPSGTSSTPDGGGARAAEEDGT
jgi:excisionase family DNA binding protein